MILFGLALIFAYLAFREIKNPAEKRNAFSWGYITVFLSLAVLCARPAYNIWQLERMLTSKAALITDRDDVSVKCNSIMGTVFAGKGTQPLAGTAYIDTGEIFFENAYCKEFINYLGDPENASQDGVFSMHVFTHEVMHIKGERNEQKTDCQAIQRNHKVGELLGVDRVIAIEHAIRYYEQMYPDHPYFSLECKPKGKMDEKLSDSIWSHKQLGKLWTGNA